MSSASFWIPLKHWQSCNVQKACGLLHIQHQAVQVTSLNIHTNIRIADEVSFNVSVKLEN